MISILVLFMLLGALAAPSPRKEEEKDKETSMWDKFYGNDRRKFTNTCMEAFKLCDDDGNNRCTWDEYKMMMAQNAGDNFDEEISKKEYDQMSKGSSDGVGIRQFCTFIQEQLANTRV
jgi:Ca2+-binding EF-hand superfamily protein